MNRQIVKAEDIRSGHRIIRRGVTIGIIGKNHVREWDGHHYRNRWRIRGVNHSNGAFVTWLAESKDSFEILAEELAQRSTTG